ncbi:hypothetical protein [Aurantiacibacter sediminis]|uniref:Uncharacterized protein n=1 Tax=Aurantiacibacter sediminis TaxID=2793064 RepID=A0ABS0N565_9SPHN|nr:hypothetical protein [Aurantiacibacter sediminis]MBH5322930.1 hypothetical protein [Aurantiacibacter sediminis]
MPINPDRDVPDRPGRACCALAAADRCAVAFRHVRGAADARPADLGAVAYPHSADDWASLRAVAAVGALPDHFGEAARPVADVAADPLGHCGADDLPDHPDADARRAADAAVALRAGAAAGDLPDHYAVADLRGHCDAAARHGVADHGCGLPGHRADRGLPCLAC